MRLVSGSRGTRATRCFIPSRKAIELGVTGFQPLAAQRCVVRLSAERAEKKMGHWQGIIESASEQCGRNRLARLAPLQDYKQWITQQDMHRRIILTPRAEQSLADWSRHQAPQAVTLVIGPEGGLSEQEEEAARRHGALPLAMGPRILRTETAALAAVSVLSAAWCAASPSTTACGCRGWPAASRSPRATWC